VRDDFFHVQNTNTREANREHICEVIDSGNYKMAYGKARSSGELRYYPICKRIVFWLAVHKRVGALQLVYKVRYGLRW
jgi:hypothetical protein